MSVASGARPGDHGKAVGALLAPVIGRIKAAIGGILGHASVQARAGDPVCPGEVIETTADERTGVRDQMAKAGRLRTETPVASISGRAHGGGFGLLSLTALIFSMMKEVRAADPDVTFLDDGNISYKDLEHGVFELVTKEAVPRHIIVEDPGETVILSRRGSSISVNQVTNTASRMEELQAAQQDVLANFANEQRPGSGTPPSFDEQLSVQPINFIQSDHSAVQNLGLPPLPSVQTTPEITIPPQLQLHSPPTLSVASGPIEIDTVLFDTFAATNGTFAATSSNPGATLTYGISGAAASNTVLNGVTYDLSATGSYGTLYLDSRTGAYSFVPNSGAINALTAPTTESFDITVSDGSLSAHQTFTITINGSNDAAIISGTATGSVIEADAALSGMPAASGTLTDTDVDNAPNSFTPVNTPRASDHGYGTFTITAAGVWTFTLNDPDGAVQALNVGDTLTETFTVTTEDGTPKVVTITIAGTNDAAVIAGETTGTAIEAGYPGHGTPTATGTLTDTDVDNTPNSFTPVLSPRASDGGYGTFTMTPTGVWAFTLNDASCAVQALNVGDTLTDTFTVTTADGTPQVVTITIAGSNDPAIISGKTTGSVVEAGCHPHGNPTATGTLTDTDVDNTPNTFTPVCSPRASDGGYGSFTMTAAGVWTFTLNDASNAVQALNVGDTLTDTFTVTTADGTPQVVTITIAGSNDPAIIAGKTTGSVVEAGCHTQGNPIATGTLTDTDVDNTPNAFTPVCSPETSNGGYGTYTMTAAGVWTYILDNNNCVVQALNDCDTLVDSFTVTTVDGTPQLVTIKIHGTDDGHRHEVSVAASDGPPDRDARDDSTTSRAEDHVNGSIDGFRADDFKASHGDDRNGTPTDRQVATALQDTKPASHQATAHVNGDPVSPSPATEHTESQSTDHGPTPGDGSNISSHGDIDSGASSPQASIDHHDWKHGGAIDAAEKHVQTIDTGPNLVFNSGIPEGGGPDGPNAHQFKPSLKGHDVSGSWFNSDPDNGDSFHFKNDLSGDAAPHHPTHQIGDPTWIQPQETAAASHGTPVISGATQTAELMAHDPAGDFSFDAHHFSGVGHVLHELIV